VINTPSSPVTLKQKLFAHIETMRPYTLLWCGLVSLTGACLTHRDLPSFQNTVLIFFIPILGWIAGLYLADYCDRDLDAIQKPHRPIPSGRITPKEAILVGAIFAITGLILTVFLDITNILLVFIASALVFCYAKITKARGLLGNLNRGALTVTTYLFGVFALGTPLSSLPLSIWIFALVFFFHDTNSNIIGALRDVQGDTTGGYQTTPVKYGIKHALYLSVILSIAYLLITIAVTRFSDVFPHLFFFYSLFTFGVIVLSFMYITLFDAKEQITRKNALLAHELFVAERIIFASAFIVGIAQSHATSLSLFMISLLLTLLFQHLLRERYELT
jgi:4-hydroxybenzoate polyprenyltransferase/geranylgeranylglycerol-phosphate geranylgeranyltransferase